MDILNVTLYKLDTSNMAKFAECWICSSIKWAKCPDVPEIDKNDVKRKCNCQSNFLRQCVSVAHLLIICNCQCCALTVQRVSVFIVILSHEPSWIVHRCAGQIETLITVVMCKWVCITKHMKVRKKSYCFQVFIYSFLFSM